MAQGWRVGSLFGIPLWIDPSWFVIVALVTISYVGTYSSAVTTPAVAWSAALATALLLFLSVLLHELGHSLAARFQGIRVERITLFLFGGIAQIARESNTPAQAFQVAIAGPLTSLGLFLLLSGISALSLGPTGVEMTSSLARINLILALFNLLPGLPLDGGQVLKALIWQVSGDRGIGTHWAARAGMLLGWAAMLGGAALWWQNPSEISGLWLVLLGWFGVRNADRYDRLTNLQDALNTLTVQAAVQRNFRVLDGNETVEAFAADWLRMAQVPQALFVSRNGRWSGLLDLEDLRLLPREVWGNRTLAELARPLAELPCLPISANLGSAILGLERSPLPFLVVLSPAGAVEGILDRADCVGLLAQQLGFPLLPGQLDQIRREGCYPDGLRLDLMVRESESPEAP